MAERTKSEPWIVLHEIVERGDEDTLLQFVDEVGYAEVSRALSRLDEDVRSAAIVLMGTERAADFINRVDDALAVELIEELSAERAAEIVDALPSSEQADILSALANSDAAAILDKMVPEEAEDAKRLLQYPSDTAGGLMITEFLAFADNMAVADVLDDMRKGADKYSDYAIQYAYVVNQDGVLLGVLRLRELLLSNPAQPLREIMIDDPAHVRVDTKLDELMGFFSDKSWIGVPVTDEANRLVGVVKRAAVNEAAKEHATRTFLKLAGLRGEEELRSMPILTRSMRRLAWLVPNIVLNLISVSVIDMFVETLDAVIALAVFLPIISDMSGCSGNQAVAVSLRELALGLVKPYELARVLFKEMAVGIINGLILGVLLGFVVVLWKGSWYLGLVVGVALMLNTLVSVSLGGAIPLILRQLRQDPALASGPILTTVTDLCGFFLALGFATLMLSKLVGIQ